MDYEDVKDNDERPKCIEGRRRDQRNVWPQDKANTCSLRGFEGKACPRSWF